VVRRERGEGMEGEDTPRRMAVGAMKVRLVIMQEDACCLATRVMEERWGVSGGDAGAGRSAYRGSEGLDEHRDWCGWSIAVFQSVVEALNGDFGRSEVEGAAAT
jgi:hypothetical protein